MPTTPGFGLFLLRGALWVSSVSPGIRRFLSASPVPELHAWMELEEHELAAAKSCAATLAAGSG